MDSDAIAILKRMAQAYLDCTSYRDTGTAATKFLGDSALQNKTVFRTAFRRPTDFRFEYTSGPMPPHGMIIHRDRSGARRWSSIEGEKEQPSLSMAIAGAAGVSDGTAFYVPKLLMPEDVNGRTFLDSTNWAMLPDADESGHACHRVTRKISRDGSETLWIDKAQLLVLRMDESRTIDGGRNGRFKTEQTIVYCPETDIDIPDTELAFGAPRRN